MRGFLFLKMQMQGKKRSKIEHLVRLFTQQMRFQEQNTFVNRMVRIPKPIHKRQPIRRRTHMGPVGLAHHA
ncbi:hypothetical protein LVJ83_04560 [Uruburuella testudinis]|uniref:Uncharacterized protein n=1 Tax=Uruburuella testudinis TaxID=1282863 RepID=A0ABY4DVQ4_9NEIS|nr:hypothetical protein [Uruburuella testudinis]UOO82740.1 hypothetical protein LVJ83_04560 [Uruburuella testudinis]